MSQDAVFSVSPAELIDILQAQGFRAQVTRLPNGTTQILSASQGAGYAVWFGNPLAGEAERFVDFSFGFLLAVEGDLPPGLLNEWNRAKRFTRVFQQEQSLLLVQDVLLAGGVSRPWLQAQCEIWDRCLSEFIQYLRNSLAQVPATEVAA